MKQFKFKIVGDNSPVTPFLRTVISAVGSGVKFVPVESQDADVAFIVDGTQYLKDHRVIIDVTSRNERVKGFHADLAGQYVLQEIVAAGRPIRKDAKDRIESLDTDPNRMACFVVKDLEDTPSLNREVPILLENDVIYDPSVLDPYSHVGLVSPGGLPMVCEKLVALAGCMPFYIGPNRGYFDMAAQVHCDSGEKFIFEVNNMVNDQSSPRLFNNHIKDKTFNTDVVSAKNARSVIGSILRAKTGDDFGFLDLTVGTQRLLKRAGIG